LFLKKNPFKNPLIRI